MNDYDLLEKRLNRIERKLFPDNIKSFYDYNVRCSSYLCYYGMRTFIGQKEYPDNLKCPCCNNNLIPTNVILNRAVVFN